MVPYSGAHKDNHSEDDDEELKYSYQLLYKRGSQPLLPGEDLRDEADHYEVPPSTVRWRFESRFRRGLSSYRDVLLEQVLEACKSISVQPLDISFPPNHGREQFVDVRFADPNQMLKVWDEGLTFDFYGTQPTLVGRGIELGQDMIVLSIQTLPSTTDQRSLVTSILGNKNLKAAGGVVDIWAVDSVEKRRFTGRVLVLFQLMTHKGTVSIRARSRIPGWLVFEGVAYLVRYPNRPAWCFHCRYTESDKFHSMHTCPVAPCTACKKKGHNAIQCPIKCKSIADMTPKPAKNKGAPRLRSRASLVRRFAELGIKEGTPEAELLTRELDLLVLSSDDEEE